MGRRTGFTEKERRIIQKNSIMLKTVLFEFLHEIHICHLEKFKGQEVERNTFHYLGNSKNRLLGTGGLKVCPVLIPTPLYPLQTHTNFFLI